MAISGRAATGLRVIGDTLFALGTVALVWFVFGLKFGWSIEKGQKHKD
ncbi:MAG: hypothetical protein ACOC0R_04475 [Mariniphaga sp.]